MYNDKLIVPDEIQHIKKRAFLAAYAECGTVTRAAEIAGINRTTHYDWVREDPLYSKACDAAYEHAAERLEQEARRRAVEGTEKPVFYQGEVCGTVTEYSDTLLMFLLKGAKPDKYKDRVSNEVTVSTPQQQGGVTTLRDLQNKRDNKSNREIDGDIQDIKTPD